MLFMGEFWSVREGCCYETGCRSFCVRGRRANIEYRTRNVEGRSVADFRFRHSLFDIRYSCFAVEGSSERQSTAEKLDFEGNGRRSGAQIGGLVWETGRSVPYDVQLSRNVLFRVSRCRLKTATEISQCTNSEEPERRMSPSESPLAFSSSLSGCSFFSARTGLRRRSS